MISELYTERYPTGTVAPSAVRLHGLDTILHEAAFHLERVFLPTWDDMAGELAAETGVNIPDSLLDRMGFKFLHWQQVKDEIGLPKLYLGSPKAAPITPITPITPKEALGTIVVERQRIQNIVEVDQVLLGGLAHDSQARLRSIGMAYSLVHDRFQATRFNVSISKHEPPFNAPEHKFHYYGERVPSDTNHPYTTAGLITQAMVNACPGTTCVTRMHTSSGEDSAFEIDYSSLSQVGSYTFHISTGRKELTFFSDDEAAKPSWFSKPVWQLSIPRYLEAA